MVLISAGVYEDLTGSGASVWVAASTIKAVCVFTMSAAWNMIRSRAALPLRAAAIRCCCMAFLSGPGGRPRRVFWGGVRSCKRAACAARDGPLPGLVLAAFLGCCTLVLSASARGDLCRHARSTFHRMHGCERRVGLRVAKHGRFIVCTGWAEHPAHQLQRAFSCHLA